MSLVAYGSSDDSEDEKETNNSDQIFNSTHNKLASVSKKQRETVKITIPALKEFKDEESHEVSNQKPRFKGGSGLFSLLPPPKNSSSLCKPGFTPYILSKKKEVVSKANVNENIKNCTSTAHPSVSSQAVSVEDQDFDNDDNQSEDVNTTFSSNDYFFLNESNQLNKDGKSAFSGHIDDYVISSSDNSIFSNLQSACIELPNQTSSVANTEFLQPDTAVQSSTSSIECSNDASDIHQFMQDKEFLKLKGRKRELEEINIIDVNADDQLTDKNEWLMKSLTEEKDMRPRKRKNNMPTQQQKRKHQITYLAFQAKERELDLKNQWSLNSRTRRETQAKYGF